MPGMAEAPAKSKSKLNFTVAADDLVEAATKVKSVIPASGEKPTLENMLLLTRNGVLELVGSDLLVTVRHAVPAAKIESDGMLMMNGARFLELIKLFAGETVAISTAHSGCVCTASSGDYNVFGGDPRDYHDVEIFDGLPGLKIKGGDLLDMLAHTQFAVSQNANRQSTHGIYFELKKDRFRLVATNMKSIAVAERTVVAPEGVAVSVVIPALFAKTLAKVVSKDLLDKEIELGTSKNAVWVRTPLATASSRIVDTNYVPYESVLSANLTRQIDCDVAAFRVALKRARYVDDFMAVFEFEPGKLTLHSALQEVGKGRNDMPVDYTGDHIKIALNPKSIDDALAVVKDKKFRFRFESHLKAAIIRELRDDGTERADFIYLTMPITLPGEHLAKGSSQADDPS